MEPLQPDLDAVDSEQPKESVILNIGPSHPCTHGNVRIVVELSGETIQRADVQVGYLHRGFEKMADRHVYRVLRTTEPLIKALKKMALDNLSNLRPHPIYVRFNYSHPPLLERIKSLEGMPDRPI